MQAKFNVVLAEMLSAYNQGKHRFEKHKILVLLYYGYHRSILKLQQNKSDTPTQS
jgi:hypothetical protein